MLVGSTGELVSFGQYVIHLFLENGGRLSIACPFRFGARARLAESPVRELPLQASDLLRVIGARVQGAKAESDGTLRLDFDSGDGLIAYTSEPGYEAYTLWIGGKEYVV